MSARDRQLTERDPTVFMVRAKYGADGLARRETARPRHRDYLRAHSHLLRFAGPTLDEALVPTGSLAILNGTRSSATTFIEQEPFFLAGMFKDVRVCRFVPSKDGRQRDLDASVSDASYLLTWRCGDAVWPGIESALKPMSQLMEYGPLTDDQATEVVGGLLLCSLPEPDAVNELTQLMIDQGGSEIDLNRWRAGNALGTGDQ